ncbi:efflux RND transporter periplasmic adaptor subunit [Rubripirellula reticaptiva]|uniref:Cobalt-zinc-cadmium resistance protein CzcB n=1 Tax=Rubripirellula reticaptiva TaxID=2528013 RepID=A0A5C6ESJ1_9BACT|nr:efflux RND transporter periplasmic adaptor subunit [Rubripirellula reticaptiva]TWU51605.1 Cobalt-zinc-cadmium resistance protein CzcB [Rubripirellula reticaptiva]
MRIKSIVAIAIASLIAIASTSMAELHAHEGFTRPVEQVELAVADSGVLAEIGIREGAQVRSGELICALDSGVLRASLAAAEARWNSRGNLAAAEATLAHRQNHLSQLELLHEKEHASDQEVIDAKLDVAVAMAGRQSAEDQLQVAKQEIAQIQSQIRRRSVVAPFDGVVVELPVSVGERVNATDGYVAKLVRLDQLRVRYDLATQIAAPLRVGEALAIHFPETNQTVTAKIDYIAAVTDSSSGTVRVEVLIDNRDGTYRSGVRCVLQRETAQVAQRR